ncbi:hypothetical protein PIB30_030325 [Stylosanthes scabra]|uniref:Uncharacterized protein n=1 Tax=Stylosanthes scabra TaxID=79078 RepID=A0ABU6TBA1_9FABA|nr:hypothetical protein [Stylosanthes scabra]
MENPHLPTFPLPYFPQDYEFYKRLAEPFPFSARPKSPTEVKTLARQCLFYWLHRLLLITQITVNPRHFDVDFPYYFVPIIKGPIPEEMLWQFSGSYLEQLFTMFAPISLWRGKLYNLLNAHELSLFSYTIGMAQDSDPWGGPFSQDPNNYDEEPGARVYVPLTSPTHVDAGIDDTEEPDEGDYYYQQSDDDNFGPLHNDFADHEPIIK